MNSGPILKTEPLDLLAVWMGEQEKEELRMVPRLGPEPQKDGVALS